MIDYHRLILGDNVRNTAFAEALRRTVKKGESIVADIGSGTGYLAFLASKFGAKQCHLYEQVPTMLKLSKDIAKANGIDNCVFHPQHSASVRNPARADILVSETLGNYALEENMLETLRDAKRFLKPDGIVIPQKLTQWIAPIVSPRFHQELDVWHTLGEGLDFSVARDVCFHNIYVRTIQASDLMNELPAKQWDAIDFREDEDSIRSAEVEWKVTKPTTMYGLGMWWDCELIPGVTLSTAPDSPRTHWEQIYLPVLDPITIEKGETVRCVIRSDTRYEVKVHVKWEVSVVDAKGKRRMQVARDMVKGQV